MIEQNKNEPHVCRMRTEVWIAAFRTELRQGIAMVARLAVQRAVRLLKKAVKKRAKIEKR
jgi:hypothetical protein